MQDCFEGPATYPLTSHDWYGDHCAAEQQTLEVLGKSVGQGHLTLDSRDSSHQIQAGELCRITYLCEKFAIVQIADARLAVTRESIMNLICARTSLPPPPSRLLAGAVTDKK